MEIQKKRKFRTQRRSGEENQNKTWIIWRLSNRGRLMMSNMGKTTDYKKNLAKLDNGLAASLTVMVGETKNTHKQKQIKCHSNIS